MDCFSIRQLEREKLISFGNWYTNLQLTVMKAESRKLQTLTSQIMKKKFNTEIIILCDLFPSSYSKFILMPHNLYSNFYLKLQRN